MLTYSQVEGALAKLHGVGPEELGAFRGRIKNLQKLGLVPASPGKGRRIPYGPGDAFLWAIALELCEFGIDPSDIVYIIQAVKEPLLKGFLQRVWSHQVDAEDVYFIIHPSFLTSGVDPCFIRPYALKSDLLPRGSFWGKDRRIAAFNISELFRELMGALGLLPVALS